MYILLQFLALLSVVTWGVGASLLTSVSRLSPDGYDFIIIGGGTAGSVLANRLSENPKIKVLVIEAGISNEDIQDVEIPFLATALPSTRVDWNFTTTAQAGLNNRSIELARGFVLGGSSSINFMTWNRGSNDYWESLANASHDPMWSWPAAEYYYLRTSTLVPPSDGHNTTGEIEPEAHGQEGPVKVSLAGYRTELDQRVADSASILGGRFAYNEDFNTGKSIGLGYVQNAIGNGSRSSAATAYLLPIVDRCNVDVIVSTRVTKILGSSVASEIDTVEISQSANGTRTKIQAKKEVLLSAGVIGTPHLLSLSGIGPGGILSDLGIDVIVDAPAVGANLVDHPLVANYFTVDSNNTWDPILRNSTLFADVLEEWETERQGLFVDTPGNTQGYFKLPTYPGGVDPSTGPLSANTEVIFSNGFAPFGPMSYPANGSYMSILAAVVSPTSRGTVTVNSTDPFAAPVIDLGILSTEFDIVAMIQVIKDIQTILATSPWEGYVTGIYGDLANATTDDELTDFIRNNAVIVNHAIGTAKIGEVVDSHLNVIGVSGLRVIDASILHTIPECHPQAIIYTIAERTAALIKRQYGI
ncbi:aryl-alcohol-oxidase from pleurotus Eryingii [Guyanagaster necrorhizus]|uniref:Aryl-alcohol-oxidase from pleurotus Eryingii n=1 Tax=Guyanagaster necrorhizus TaxID=856835 RepID=A0A9P8ASY4_9AGAR|nr:aryl-alcohol-oxidase from pleurotus Eryingii [Guyanagaster necrorhizus MCA 3950]KAG7446883.1 aryl-alcohol-oxidase from pleurotus Eryingii [Guyanagaster necrorhizus MCA 3950]